MTHCPTSPARRWLARLALSAAAGLGLHAAAFAASQVVTVCGRDDAPGGLNLATALAAGGDIVIRCPAGQQEIVMTATHLLQNSVRLDGEKTVTLRGPVAGPLFTVGIALSLSRLTVANPRTPATAAAPGAGSIAIGPGASITLEDVTTQDSVSAYAGRSVLARNSRFLRNGDPAHAGSFTAIVNAERIELSKVSFTGNFEHPVAGVPLADAQRPALSNSVVIADSVFTGNASPLLLSNAHVTIRRTRFEGNGTPAGKWGGAWSCCGGAISLVHADAELAGVEFHGNATGGFGGAIYALGSRLRIRDAVFAGNEARAGGAVMFWGRPPKVNIWSSREWHGQPVLELRRTQFRANAATASGGALLFAGRVEGDQVLFTANRGGAIVNWRSAVLADPHDGVFDALVAASLPAPADHLALSRPILVDNVAENTVAAIAGGRATVEIGNGLIARNRHRRALGGSVSGMNLTLVNTTIADNPAGGMMAGLGSTIRLANTILLRNLGGHCLAFDTLQDLGGNFQYPGSDCGAVAAAREPGLDADYRPGIASAARGNGNGGLCAAFPQVAGIDLFGRARGTRGRCDSGAIERPQREALAAGLGLGEGQAAVSRLLWLLGVLCAIVFLLALVVMAKRRRRRRG